MDHPLSLSLLSPSTPFKNVFFSLSPPLFLYKIIFFKLQLNMSSACHRGNTRVALWVPFLLVCILYILVPFSVSQRPPPPPPFSYLSFSLSLYIHTSPLVLLSVFSFSWLINLIKHVHIFIEVALLLKIITKRSYTNNEFYYFQIITKQESKNTHRHTCRFIIIACQLFIFIIYIS